VAFANQAEEAFLEGHVEGFEHLGGVPGLVRTEYVPQNIFGVLWPARLCGGDDPAPMITAVNGPSMAPSATHITPSAERALLDTMAS
jgi:hypothetical protein